MNKEKKELAAKQPMAQIIFCVIGCLLL